MRLTKIQSDAAPAGSRGGGKSVMRGFWAVLRKEWIQMTRDRGTLVMALVIPIFELVLFGVIDTNVKHVRTAVFDQSRTRESRELVTDLVNTVYFDVVEEAPSHEALRESIVAGRASVGIEIPPDYARRRLRGQPADFLVLIDGSDSTISSQTLGAANGVALQRSLEEIARRTGIRDLPLQAHPLLLFNPDSRSANLLIPGLIAILLTFSGTILAAFGIVRERERGTLEQLMVTPASPVGVVLGKLLPYMGLGFVQLATILVVMVVFFKVPIHGSLPLFLAALDRLPLLAPRPRPRDLVPREDPDGRHPAGAGVPPALGLSVRLRLPALLAAGPPARRRADPPGDPLHQDLAGDHHPRGGLRGHLAERRRAARDRRRADPGQHAGVQEDDLVATVL